MADKSENQADSQEEDIQDFIAGSDKETRLARTLRRKVQAKRRQRADQYRKAGIEAGGKGLKARYRQIKSVLRWVRGFSLVGTCLGDVVFSFSLLFLSLIGEWAFCKWQHIPMFKEEHIVLDKKTGQAVVDDRTGEVKTEWRAAPFAFVDKAVWYIGWLVIILVPLFAIVLVLGAAHYLEKIPLGEQVLKKII